jgi:hypothetical protein
MPGGGIRQLCSNSPEEDNVNRLRATALSLLSLSLAVALTACGGDDTTNSDTGTDTSASASPSAETSPTEDANEEPSDDGMGDADQMIEISIAGGTVTPTPGKTSVKLGSTVMLMVTSDVADAVHVHGYDQEFELAPGETAEFTFTADIPGTFEVETHESGAVLTELEVK